MGSGRLPEPTPSQQSRLWEVEFRDSKEACEVTQNMFLATPHPFPPPDVNTSGFLLGRCTTDWGFTLCSRLRAWVLGLSQSSTDIPATVIGSGMVPSQSQSQLLYGRFSWSFWEKDRGLMAGNLGPVRLELPTPQEPEVETDSENKAKWRAGDTTGP